MQRRRRKEIKTKPDLRCRCAGAKNEKAVMGLKLPEEKFERRRTQIR
jgi:hypothetical protein